MPPAADAVKAGGSDDKQKGYGPKGWGKGKGNTSNSKGKGKTTHNGHK